MISRIAALVATALASAPACAAASEPTGWLSWLIVGGIALVVAGILLRTLLAARFPKGYGPWARQRRDAFAERNDQWDRDDEEFRK